MLLIVGLTAGSLSFGSPAFADLSLFAEIIVNYNMDHHKRSLADGSYRGEEGILRLRPDVAESLGLKRCTYEDYNRAQELFGEAEELSETLMDMMEAKKTDFSIKFIEKFAETSLAYKTTLESAKKMLLIYRSKIKPDDERLDRSVCAVHLDSLLVEAFGEMEYNLRDALAYFYNKCQGLDKSNGPLTPENVPFVNHVFNRFVKDASDEDLRSFDLDLQTSYHLENGMKDWLLIARKTGFGFFSSLNSLIEQQKIDDVDPLLFLALMKKESRFDPNAVSYAGAVGLTQIMPKTAESLGMKNVFSPPYFAEVRSYVLQERRLRKQAQSLVESITEDNKLAQARQVMKLMVEARKSAKKKSQLHERYKKDLLKRGTDDRLDPRKAMEFGLKYFVTLMRKQSGDISLSLASYNAGPHSVKKHGGIPPYPETVSYRNGVLKYYRYYRNFLRKNNH